MSLTIAKEFPNNVLEFITDPKRKDLKLAKATNYKDEKGIWHITIHLNKIHRRCKPETYAMRINDLYLEELLCSLYRLNTEGYIPPCETGLFKLCRCPCGAIVRDEMRLVIK